MNTKLQLIILGILIFAIVLLIAQIKKKKLDLKYSLAWLLLILVFIIIDCLPNLLVFLSDIVGIATPSNMLFTCGFVFTLIIIYTLTVAVSRASDNIRKMAQRIALLEKELKELKKEE